MQIEVLSRQQLVRRAGSLAAARRLVSDADWRRVVRDAYVERPVPDDIRSRVAALRTVLPSDVAVSHRTALWLLGLDVTPELVEVTVPRGRHLVARPGVRPYTARLSQDELVAVEGLLVVSAARALVDVARREEMVEAVVVGDAALRAGVTTCEAVTASIRRSAGLRHVERARRWLPHLEPRSESPMESRLRMRLVLGGVPRPQAQFDLYDEVGHCGRADLYLDGVVIEYDGRASHSGRDEFTGERRRQSRIAELGCEIRRFTAPDYYLRSAQSVCAEVLRAVAQAKERSRPGLWSGPDTLRRPRCQPLPTLASAAAARAAAGRSSPYARSDLPAERRPAP